MTGAEESAVADAEVLRRVVRSTKRFDGRVWDVRTDLVDLGDGQQVERDVIEHPGAVGIVAVDDDLQVLLVQQYRHPVSAMLWEPPAGLLDVEGEHPRDAAARELFEEAGYLAADWFVLIDAFTSPGGSNEAVRLYLARTLSEVDHDKRYVGDGEEREMPIRWVPLAQARDAVMGILAAASVLLEGRPTVGLRSSDAPWLRSGTRAG
jgi:ADP-ribose pyrophosphatase